MDDVFLLGCFWLLPLLVLAVLYWGLRSRLAHLEAEVDLLPARLDREAPTSKPAQREEPPPVAVQPPPSPADFAVTDSAPSAPPALASTVPPPTPPSPAPPIDWEKWLGVRGAAVLGGIVFALAGLYLFRYSIQQGLISPAVRVVFATLAGLGAIVGSQKLRVRYAITSQALAAGGIVVLYAGFWASRSLYALVPISVAFVLMGLTTAVAALLAVKQHNRLAAYLGLVGGFATPIALSTGQNAPIALFSYVLMLDVALLTVAFWRRWSSVAALALGGTVLLQAGWVLTRMEPDQVYIAYGVLVVFAVLFGAFAVRFRFGDESGGRWHLMHGAALLTPAFFLAYFAALGRLHVDLVPVGVLLVMLTGAVGFVHRRRANGERGLLVLATSAQVLVMGTAVLSRGPADLAEWTLPFMLLGVSVASQFGLSWATTERHRADAMVHGAWSTALMWGLLTAAWVRAQQREVLVPYVVVTLVLALSLVRFAHQAQRPGWHPWVGAALALAFTASRLAGQSAGLPFHAGWALGPVVVGLVLLLAFATFTRERLADVASIVYAAVTLLLAAFSIHSTWASPIEPSVAFSLLAAGGVSAALRARTAAGTLVVTALAAGCLSISPLAAPGETLPVAEVFAVIACGALGLHLLPAVAASKHPHRSSWDGLAVGAVLPVLFFPLWLAWRRAFGIEMQGVLPVALATVSLASALLLRRRLPASNAFVWLMAAALCFLAVAVPLQLSNEWVTISWAAMAAALLALWRKYDSRGLKWLALTLSSLVAVRLLLNPEVLLYHHRIGAPGLNWLTYTYLIPAGCLGFGAWVLSALEVERARGFEKPWYKAKAPFTAAGTGMASALIVFAYATLAVFDVFSPDDYISLSLTRQPARALTLSLVWLGYASSLLAVGMWRQSKALRWLSLLFMFFTTAKVFLYDLGELKDLYRVASLMGLAISLLVISVAYQRFVFFKQEAPSP